MLVAELAQGTGRRFARALEGETMRHICVFGLRSLVAGFALLSKAAMADEGELKSFGDWMAGCDNLKRCAALSLPREDEGDTIAYLRLERDAGPGAPATLVLRLLGEWKMLSTPVRLQLDGATFPIGGEAVSGSADSEMLSLTFQPAEVAAFITAARKATRLTVTVAGQTASVSLAGSVAAMLWIDDQQGRLDTISALIRGGNGTNIPAAPVPPRVAARRASGTLSEQDGKALAAALRAQLRHGDADLCDDDETLIASDEAWPLDDKRRLVGLACFSGAYNLTTGFWMVEGSDVTTATPVVLAQGEGDASNMLTNADFDPTTGQLSFFSKGRGIGDCGATGAYAWTGTAFVQTAYATMDECRGIAPDDWITLYRSAAE